MGTRVDRTTLGPNDDGRRLDRVVRKHLPSVPLSRIYRALRSREISINGRRARADTRVHEGDILEIAETLQAPAGRRESRGADHHGAAQRLRPRIVFEDDHLLVVAKERGELTHGPNSLETLVRSYLAGGAAGGVSFRPGPVHRLDRNTSGLVIFSASLKGARAAGEALEQGLLEKRYVALLEGHLKAVRWEDLLVRDRDARKTAGAGGEAIGATGEPSRLAVTTVEPLVSDRDATLALVRIETGRTHQIRAQAAMHGHPLAGDRKYGGHGEEPYLLHAASLSAPERANLGFRYLWCPLPQRAARRIETVFGAGAPALVTRLLSVPPP